MAITISVALQKGGVGKSTTSQCLANVFGSIGKKVLVIDMDSQANLTDSSGVYEPEFTITKVMSGACNIKDAIIKCKYYDLLAGDDYLTNVEWNNVSPTLLDETINPIKDLYDYIIIDTPPSLGNLLFNSLSTSDYVIIPVDSRPYALKGLNKLYATINEIQNGANVNLKILGILLTRYNNRTKLSKEMKDVLNSIAKEIDTIVFDTIVRESIVIAESQGSCVPLIDYAKNNNLTVDYTMLGFEILKRINEVNFNEKGC